MKNTITREQVFENLDEVKKYIQEAEQKTEEKKKVVIEIKSVEALNEVHLAQTLTYMKLGGYKLGLLINFNVSLLKDGIRRIANKI